MKNLDYIKLVLGSVSTNTYILYNKETKECIIIDPAAEAQKIIESIEENALYFLHMDILIIFWQLMM